MSNLDIDFDVFMQYNSFKQRSSTEFYTHIMYNIHYLLFNKEILVMSENETILLNLIRQHKNPEEALLTAIQVILLMLNQCQDETPLEKSTID